MAEHRYAEIDFIVDKHHVGVSLTDVVKDIARRCRRARLKGHVIGRHERKVLYRYAVKRHQENRRLYRDVMNGNV